MRIITEQDVRDWIARGRDTGLSIREWLEARDAEAAPPPATSTATYFADGHGI
jgi:hypothetical protein